MTVEMIPSVDASKMPQEVEGYCTLHDISTHYQNDIVWVENDGNAFAEWLKEIGVKFEEDGVWVGIFAT